MSEDPRQALPAGNLLGGRKKRRFLWLLGVALYVGVVWFIGWRQIGDALLSVNPIYFALFVASMLGAFLVRALKWRIVLGSGQNAVGLLFLSKVGGGLSPGRLGELAPLMLREHRTPRMGAWIALDRLLETAATLGLGIFGLMALGLPQPGIIATFLAAIVVLVIAPFYVLTRRRWFLWIASKTSEQSLPHRVAMMIAAVSDEIFTFGKKVPLASAITLVGTCGDILTSMLLYRCFGFQVSFAVLATIQCAHGIASAVPFMPNASGVPYFAAAFLLHKLAGIPEAVLAASVGISVTMSNVVLWSCFGLTAGSLRRFRQGRSPMAERQCDQGTLFDHLASKSCLYVYGAKALDLIDGLVPSKGRVLDVGCGDGTVARRFSAESVTGFDISPRCAALACEVGLNALVADARGSFPFQPEAFDTVYCVDVLHHLEQAWEGVFAQVDAVLKPGGTLAIVEPDARNLFVRWTQAPGSPIRVAPYYNEPAIHPDELTPHLERLGYTVTCTRVRIEGWQVVRGTTFPFWKRVLKAPFVAVMNHLWLKVPNKLAIVAKKPL